MMLRHRPSQTPRQDARPRLPRTRRLVAITLAAAIGLGTFIGLRGLHAAGAPTIYVNPAGKAQLWYKPTPITIQISTANFSAPGQTPVAGYQYGLSWDPTVLQWVSGPNVGPLTPTPVPAVPGCLQVVFTSGTATPTNTGTAATYTPTSTPTPGPGTPSNTPTATYTPSLTPTPGGYINVACFSLAPPLPNATGVVGTFVFQPLATAPAASLLNLIDVKAVDFYGVDLTPAVVSQGGNIALVSCHDVNGDGKVNILDLSLVAGAYGAVVGDPRYKPIYDANNDGRINLLDLSAIAAAYGLFC